MVQALKGSGIVISVDMAVDEVAGLIFLHDVQEGFKSAVGEIGPISTTGGGRVGQKYIEPLIFPEGKAKF